MDKNLQELEDRLAGLVPRALSEEGGQRLEAEVDRLASEAGGDVKSGRSRRAWAGLGAAAAVTGALLLIPFDRADDPGLVSRPDISAAVELVSFSRQVTDVAESDWVMGDGHAPPYRYRNYVVTGTEEFYDNESGLSVTVVSESEENVPVVLTQL